jgi:protein disulfide-isomerase A1
LASSPVRLAKVDGTENEDLARRFEVKSYPSIQYFRNGKPSEYKGGRTAREIVGWVYRKIEPKTFVIKSDEDLAKFQELNEVFSLGVFNSMNSAAAKLYQGLADEDTAHVYAMTINATTKSKLFFPRNVGDKEFIIVMKNFDEMRSDLALPPPSSKMFSEEKISTFIRLQSTPPVQEFSAATMARIASSPIKQHVLFFTDKDAPEGTLAATVHENTMETYRQVSSNFKGKLLFVNVPISQTKIVEYFNITASALPAMVIIDFTDATKGMQKFPYSGANEEAEISSFLSELLEGGLVPEPSSPAQQSNTEGEDLSPADTQGNVIVVKTKSFDSLVLNNTQQDVLIEFYAPWCGHCKNLGTYYACTLHAAAKIGCTCVFCDVAVLCCLI